MDNTPLVKRTTSQFIPQRSRGALERSRYVNAFFILCLVLFFGTLFLWGGLLIYKETLKRTRIDLSQKVEKNTKSILSDEFITDFESLEKRLVAADGLLRNHITLTPLLALLEELTLSSSVRFSEFSFKNDLGVYAIQLKGAARDFASLAYQAEVFQKDPFIQNAAFSNFSIDDLTGNVFFMVDLQIDPKLISYRTDAGVSGLEN